MRIFIDTPRGIAKAIAQQYVELLAVNPYAVLGFAAGNTPLPLYRELIALCRAGCISFKHATSFNLDAYIGLAPTHPQSYRHFMEENLFSGIDLPAANIHVPSAEDTERAQLRKYDEAIEDAGGVDLQLLGIGGNGHIGFNEPGTSFGSDTHIVELTEQTRRAKARFFSDIGEVPTHAATMGIRTVMHAKKMILIATGSEKAQAVYQMSQGDITPIVPASVLQLHLNCMVYCDKEAASLL